MSPNNEFSMKYNLFIDDERDPPPSFYRDCFVIVARSSKQAIREITEYGMPQAISFDHDLGGNDTAMVVVDWIIENILDSKITLPKGFEFKVHSANVIGGQNIESKMTNLLNSRTPKTFSKMIEEAKEGEVYWFEKVKLDLSVFINDYLKENNLREEDFAIKLNKSIDYVNGILSAEIDLTLSELTVIFRAMNKKVKVTLEDL